MSTPVEIHLTYDLPVKPLLDNVFTAFAKRFDGVRVGRVEGLGIRHLYFAFPNKQLTDKFVEYLAARPMYRECWHVTIAILIPMSRSVNLTRSSAAMKMAESLYLPIHNQQVVAELQRLSNCTTFDMMVRIDKALDILLTTKESANLPTC